MTETMWYLGYEIEVAEHDLTITSAAGETLVENARITITSALRFIRTHRRLARTA